MHCFCPTVGNEFSTCCGCSCVQGETVVASKCCTSTKTSIQIRQRREEWQYHISVQGRIARA